MEYADQQITCSDCGGVFVFTAGEQEFYARKGFSSPPKRCKPCRETRRQSRGGGSGGSDGVYRAPGFRDESPARVGGSFRGPREQRGGSPQGGSRNLQHEIICAECGQKATVPFRPAQGKPVYCRECFQGRGGGDDFGNR